MKTIRQIADEIGVSKQTVYKRYKGKLHTVCAPYAHTEQGVLYIEEQGETLIKQDFLQKECSVGAHTYAHTERSNGEVLEQSENVGVIAVLQTTIDTLQGRACDKGQADRGSERKAFREQRCIGCRPADGTGCPGTSRGNNTAAAYLRY